MLAGQRPDDTSAQGGSPEVVMGACTTAIAEREQMNVQPFEQTIKRRLRPAPPRQTVVAPSNRPARTVTRPSARLVQLEAGRGRPADGRAPVEGLVAQIEARQATLYERYLKGAIDALVALMLLVALFPVVAVVALVVLAHLGAPVLIKQRRVGRDGRAFNMYKFRTMRPDRRSGDSSQYLGPDRRLTHKSPNDPRHTPIGRHLRRMSLDELPQLFNVLRGDMSLIGPRPELCAVVDRYQPWQHVRHVVKPGITGHWQVTERANGTLLHERVDLDLVYISRLSFRADMRILFRTPGALLRRGKVH